MTLASIPALFHTSSHRVCYRTCVRTYPNGTEVCETLSRAEVITEPHLLTQPTDPTLQGMYFTTRLASPGFFARKQHTSNVRNPCVRTESYTDGVVCITLRCTIYFVSRSVRETIPLVVSFEGCGSTRPAVCHIG